MRKEFRVVCLLICFLLLAGVTSLSFADDATVLPKGIFSPGIKSTYYFPHTHRYNPDGDVEDIAADYNLSLDSSVFPLLSFIEESPIFSPYLSGPASIGDSEVSMEITRAEIEFSLAYGITDRLSAGLMIPYLFLRNEIDSKLNADTANLGKNPYHGIPEDPFGGQAPIIPTALGGTPLDTEDVQQLLGRGLDVNSDGAIDIPGFGYKRFETFDKSGIGDIEAGVKYQYLNTEDWRLAFVAAMRFPTGEIDDPDDLSDLSFGDRQYDILLRLNNDYTGIDDLLLNATFRYDIQLPDHEVRRIPDNVNQQITLNRENVKRNLGDAFEFEISGKKTFAKVFDVLLLYNYAFKTKDSVSGEEGFAYETLEDETDMSEHIIKTGLSFSTIPWFKEKTFSIPFIASLQYRNKFAGTNNVLKSQFVSLSLTTFF